MNTFSFIVFIGVLFTSVISQKSRETSSPNVVLRHLENESEISSGSNTVASTTTIYLESSHDIDPAEECVCTPFNLCKTYESTEEGGGLINIRSFGPCDSYLDVCCKEKPTLSTENYISSSSTDSSDSTESSENSDNSEGDSDQKKHSNTDGGSSEESPSENCSCEDEDSVKETYVGHPSESSSESSSQSAFESPSESSFQSTFESSSESSSQLTFESSSESSSESEITPETPTFGVHQNGQSFYNSHNDHKERVHECGKWNKNGVGFRIFNDIDSETQFGEFPSMIAIFKEEELKGEKKLVYLCGGSLIKTDVVLTAAHCVIKVNPKTLVIRAGEWDIKTIKEIRPHQDIISKEVVTHPDYKSAGLHNDVALIFTETPFILDENVQIACLDEYDSSDVDESLPCITTGWGKTVTYNNFTISKKTTSGNIKTIGHYEVSILKKVTIPIVPNDKCMEALKSTRLGPKFVLHDSFVCAGGEKGKDACKGDGGSPLFCPSKHDPDNLVQVGIVSWGISCGVENIPGVYVNVAVFQKWINNQIENHSSV
ncbi:Hypothetical protein CINCED_3A011857 [Cinara cedri]|nr:Hypothetical protein CINCED_3A011857 [Cinara cedri]